VAIIGAGPLGRWLALSAARAGFRVLLEDVMPANLHHAQEMLRRELGPAYFAEQLGSGAKAQDLSGGFVRGLKPPPPSESRAGGEQGAGAKAHRESDAVAARMNSCPDTELSFAEEHASGAEAQGHFGGRMRGLKPPPPSVDAAGPSASLRFAQEDSAGGVAFVSSIEDAVREADLVIDCVPDELESKLEIFWLLDRMAPPRTVLATPTTRMSIEDLANCTYRPDKCVAIVAEASSLAAGLSGEILLRTTGRTTAQTQSLVEEFWRRLGFVVRLELEGTRE
jgi:3-hydroxybutyryl-CoA dehydrogenase